MTGSGKLTFPIRTYNGGSILGPITLSSAQTDSVVILLILLRHRNVKGRTKAKGREE